ncbi:apolipoprotein N-acyltransferase [Sodalis sp. CWE]|uniref:apolipoprotein N-acyltransferase n=1 Tax=Sodalis sp. CWE TaxID=2803816 RepID=UPI001C7CCE04|nr:apolipoprotein N-acyltransferase [Sodalis sp. CWE]
MSLFFKHRKRFCVPFAFITGASGTLAFSPYGFWPAAIFSLSGLLGITLNLSVRQASWLGFIWGLGFFGVGINWIYVCIAQYSGLPKLVNILLIVILTNYMALYPMFFTILLVRLWPYFNCFRLALGAPTLWSVTEFLRARILTGFPWLEFGYSQIDGPLKGVAPLFGVQTITFLLVMISGLIIFALLQRQKLALMSGLIIPILFYPLCSLRWYQSQSWRTVSISLVQGNIPQSIKWERNQIASTLEVYLQKTLSVLGKSKIVIWPESAIPDSEITQSDFLTQLDKQLRKNNTNLITGIIDARSSSYGKNYFNSIILLGGPVPYQYPSKERYDKHHLVPFGEIVPFANLLRPLAPMFNLPMSSLTQGPYQQPQLQAAGIKLTAVICYEIIFGNQVRDNFRPDTDFLLTVSNDAWFGNSIGPWQHLQMARMRSLELGRPLLRSTNNGITAVISASGTVQAQLPQFTRGILNVCVTPTTGMTLYAQLGSWPIWIIIILTGLVAFVLDRYRNFN